MIAGIVGFGTLGRAIAAGLEGDSRVGEIVSTRRDGDNATLARRSDVLFLCVKPFQMQRVVREIAPALTPDKLAITAAASVSSAQVEGWIGRADIPVVRAMPNTPFRVGEGMTVLAAGSHATKEHLELARSLFASQLLRRSPMRASNWVCHAKRRVCS